MEAMLGRFLLLRIICLEGLAFHCIIRPVLTYSWNVMKISIGNPNQSSIGITKLVSLHSSTTTARVPESSRATK